MYMHNNHCHRVTTKLQLINKQTNSVALVHERTIPVGEVSANFCG